MLALNYLAAVLAAVSPALGRSIPTKHSPPDITTIFQLDRDFTWFENIAVRASGKLLVTRTDVPEIWTIDPFTKSGSRLVSVPGVNSLLGITETKPDVFVFAAANFTFQTGFEAGSAQMWELRFTNCAPGPSIRLLGDLPNAGLPNGVIPWDKESVLVADTSKGQVLRFNFETGRATSVLQDPTMLPTPNITLQFGVNGIDSISVKGKTYLYFTNTELGLFCRVPVDAKTAIATGPVEIILRGVPGDDLLVLDDGSALIADNAGNTIVKVTPDGRNSTFAGSLGSLDLASVTSFKFGRTHNDRGILYAATAGGYLTPVNGTAQRPANVAAVEFGREWS